MEETLKMSIFQAQRRANKEKLGVGFSPCTQNPKPSIVCQAAVTSRQKAPPNENYQTEEGLYDCVVVGGGISGLVTAQAFVSDHSKTIKK